MKMSNKVHRYPRYIVVDIESPIFETEEYSRVRVNEKYVKEASLTGRILVVRTPKGEQGYFPKTLNKQAKKVKEVFKFPNNPMVMVELDVPKGEKKDNDYWVFS